MRFIPAQLPEVIIIEPDVYRDSRGFFLETYHSAKYRAGGILPDFVQDNHSSSVRNTVRGIHFQRTKPQGKLIRVIQGEIWDVAVDLRLDSTSFGKWCGVLLSAETFRQLYIPPGFGHGFCVLSSSAHVEYKCTELYDPADEAGVAYNDPDIAISWPIDSAILSDRDRRNPTLAAYLAEQTATAANSTAAGR